MFSRVFSSATTSLQAKHPSPGSEDAGRQSLWRRLLDFVFGYDFFISYSWSDGGRYAGALARQLKAQGFEIFLDRDDYASGDDWKKVGAWKLRRTSQLVLIGSPAALVSGPVVREIEIFSRTGRRIVPIDFDGSLEWKSDDVPLAPYLPPEILRIRERASALQTGPSEQVVATLRQTFNLVRQDKKRARVFGIIAFVLGIFAVAAAASAVIAWQQRNEAQHQALVSAHEAYVSDIELSELYRHAGDPDRAIDVLRKHLPGGKLQDLREFAWRHLWRLYDNHRFAVYVGGLTRNLDVSRDGKTLAITGGNHLVTLWDIGTGLEVGRLSEANYTIGSATFVAGGARIATQVNDGLQLWDRKDLKEPVTTIPTKLLGVLSGEKEMLVGNADTEQLQLIDPRTGKVTNVRPREQFGYVTDYSISPDRTAIAVVCERNRAFVLDAVTGQMRRVAGLPLDAGLLDVRLTSDGALLVVRASNEGFYEVVVHDIARGAARLRLRGPKVEDGGFVATAVSHDGGKIALLTGNPRVSSPLQHSKLVVFDARTGEELYTLDETRTGFVTAMAFSPSADLLATGDRNHQLTLWDAGTGRPKTLLGIHHGSAMRQADAGNRHQEEGSDFIKNNVKGIGISTILFSPNGNNIVTANEELGWVRVWNVEGGDNVYPLPSQGDHQTAVAFSPDGSLVMTGDVRGGVASWRASDGAAQSRAAGHHAAIDRLAFSADGQKFASTSKDGVLKLWRTADLAGLGTFAGFQGETRTLIVGEDRLVHLSAQPTSSAEQRFALTSWPVGRDEKPALKLFSSPLAALSPDGARLAYLQDDEDRHGCRWIFWNVEADVLQAQWSLDDSTPCKDLGVQGAVWSPNGKLLAFGGPWAQRTADDSPPIHGAIRIFDIDAAGERPPLLLPLNTRSPGTLAGMEFSPDSRALATLSALPGEDEPSRMPFERPVVTLWDVSSLEKKRVFQVSNVRCGSGGECVQLGGFSSGGKSLVLIVHGQTDFGAEVREAVVWQLDDKPGVAFEYARTIEAVAISPTADRIATVVSPDDMGAPSILWDYKSADRVASLGNYERSIVAVARSPDGRMLVQTTENPVPNGVRSTVVDLATGEELTSGIDPRNQGHRVTDVSPNADLMATLDETGSVTIRDRRTRRVISSFDSKMVVADRREEVSWQQPLPLLVFGPQGHTIATLGTKQAILWDVKDGKLLHELPGTPQIFFTPGNGSYAATVDCKTISVYDTRSGRQVRTFSTANCADGAAVSADGSMLLSLMSGTPSPPAEARVWTPAGPASGTVLIGYEDGGAFGAFSPDGKSIATAGPAGSINIWDPVTGRKLLGFTLPESAQVEGVNFSDDGLALVVGYPREARVWYAAPDTRK